MSTDWIGLFALRMSPLELFVRGTAMYWFLIAVFRIVLKRDVGAIGVADVLLLVLIADAAQNAMAGEYTSIGEGLVLVSTLIGWNLLFDFLAFKSPRLRRLLQPPPLPLIRDGRICPRNLRRELISSDELWSELRRNGIHSLDEVESAYMESDGNVSVVRRKATQDGDV